MKLIHIKLLLTAIFWGGTFIAGRSLSDHVAPFSAAFLRFVIASIPLLYMTYRMEGRFPPIQKEKVFYLVLLGLTGVFSYNVFFFKGLRLIHAGRASLIIANNPIFIAIASFFLFREKLNIIKIVGIVVSVTGAMVAISRGNLQGMLTESFGRGDIFIFVAVLSWVSYSLIGKRVMQDFSAIEAVTYASVAGAIMLFPVALAEGMPTDIFEYSLANWFSLFYLGFFGTVLGFVWYYEGIKKLGPSKASLFINFVPISAIILAFLFLDEPITISLLAGAAMVSLGVYMTNSGSLYRLRYLRF
jgi:drug/metabolite transporter (DMT)-like permease